jgi:NitT/TauT family transport system substrate-binding protein
MMKAASRASRPAWLAFAVTAFAALAPVSSSFAGYQITVTQYGRLATGLPWFVALKRGLFKQAGLDIDEIVSGDCGGTTLRNTLASKSPIGEVATSAVVAAIESGVRIKIIYAATNDLGDMIWGVPANSPLNSARDLVGKAIGYTNPKSASEAALRLVLEAQGIPFNKVKAISTGGIGGGVTMMSKGALDSAVIPGVTLTKSKGALKALFRAGEIVPADTWAVGVTTPEFAAAHPEVLRKVIATRRAAIEWIEANPIAAAPYLAEYLGVSIDIAQQLLPQYIGWRYVSKGAFDKRGLDMAVHGLSLMGVSNGAVDLSKFVDQSFLPKELQSPL